MCPHSKTVIETSGSMYFSGGELFDTVKETVVCMDCGSEMETATCSVESNEEIPF